MDDHLTLRVPTIPTQAATAVVPPIVERGYLLKVLCRRKGLIAATIIGCALAALLVTHVLPPRYTAALKIAFEARGSSPGEFQGTGSASGVQEEAGIVAGILSEVEILKSRELAEKVIDKLDLDQNPEFNPALTPSAWPTRTEVVAWLRGQLPAGWLPPSPPLSAEERTARERGEVFKRFETHLEVKPVGHSRVFNVTFTSADPALAAQVANTLGDAYFASRYEERLANARRASEWLASNVQQLRNKVVEAERNVAVSMTCSRATRRPWSQPRSPISTSS